MKNRQSLIIGRRPQTYSRILCSRHSSEETGRIAVSTVSTTFLSTKDLAGVRLGLLVVIDTHEEEVVDMLRHFCRVLYAEDLVDGGVGILVIFQLQDDGGGIYILARDEHQIGKTLTRSQLAVYDIYIFTMSSKFFFTFR